MSIAQHLMASTVSYPSQAAERTVWYFEDSVGAQRPAAGFLVAESGPIESARLVAVVFADDPSRPVGRDLSIARRIAKDPAYAGRSAYCVDLRRYGRPTSEFQMPGWVYGLSCHPLNMMNERLKGMPKHPNPFCKFRFASMLRQVAKHLVPAA